MGWLMVDQTIVEITSAVILIVSVTVVGILIYTIHSLRKKRKRRTSLYDLIPDFQNHRAGLSLESRTSPSHTSDLSNDH